MSRRHTASHSLECIWCHIVHLCMLGWNEWARKQEEQGLLPPRSPQMKQFLRRGNGLQGADVTLSWDRVRELRISGCQILLYLLKQARQGFDFSAPAVVKLVAVPMYSPQCLNRATGHHLHSDYEQKDPLSWLHVHTGDLIRSQLWEEEGNATGAGWAQGRDLCSQGGTRSGCLWEWGDTCC